MENGNMSDMKKENEKWPLVVAGICTFFGLPMLIFGIYKISKGGMSTENDYRYTNVVGNVVDVRCGENNCIYTFTYSVRGNTYVTAYADLSTTAKHAKGDSVNLVVGTSNPAVVQFMDSQNVVDNEKAGWNYVIVSLILLLFGWGIYFFMNRK